MKNKIETILSEVKQKIANIKEKNELFHLHTEFLGKNGKISTLLKDLKNLSADERPKIGEILNKCRNEVENLIKLKTEELDNRILQEKLDNEKIDVTIPVKPYKTGTAHPISVVQRDLMKFFESRGFEIKYGNDVETDYYCFEALNVPKDHPARDAQDSFYIDPETVLRTHTSATQIRTMEQQKPPIKMVSTGMVYRIDDIDGTHSPIFNQLEVLVVDENVTMCDLKGMLEDVLKFLLGEHTQIKLRPSYFPFTEPSAEVDVTCPKCAGKGCSLCKNTGFIEMLGCGMVHPKVLERNGIDSEKYSGYAIGFGLDRMAMGRYGIDNIREFYENDINMLKQLK